MKVLCFGSGDGVGEFVRYFGDGRRIFALFDTLPKFLIQELS